MQHFYQSAEEWRHDPKWLPRLWYKQMNLAIGPSGRGQTLVLARAISQASHDLKIKSWIRLLLKRMKQIWVLIESYHASY